VVHVVSNSHFAKAKPQDVMPWWLKVLKQGDITGAGNHHYVVPAVAASVKIPVIAAGGIGPGVRCFDDSGSDGCESAPFCDE
jgi:hypothetical protein